MNWSKINTAAEDSKHQECITSLWKKAFLKSEMILLEIKVKEGLYNSKKDLKGEEFGYT